MKIVSIISLASSLFRGRKLKLIAAGLQAIFIIYRYLKNGKVDRKYIKSRN